MKEVPGVNETKLSFLRRRFRISIGRSVIREALSRLRMLGILKSYKRRGLEVAQPDILIGLDRVIIPQILSQKTMEDLVLAAKVKAAIINEWARVNVKAHDGEVFVQAKVPIERETSIERKIVKTARNVSGVKKVTVSLIRVGSRYE